MVLDSVRPGRFGALAFAGLALVALFGLGVPAVSTPAAASVADADRAAAVDRAIAWLRAQQQPDGGFEVAAFAGFETRDAALAIAEAAQTGPTWSTSEARAAVEATTTAGRSPIDALHDYAATGIDAGGAAKLVVLTTEPLGLSATDFGGVDLTALIAADRQPDGSYGVFSNTLWVALAQRVLVGSMPADTIAAIRGAQQANGGWGFAGDPAAADLDPDTTGLALQALAATGPTGDDVVTDAAITRGLALLDAEHGADGSWRSPFDPGNPNSTALAMLGIAGAGHDPSAPCFHTAGVYADPAEYLLGTQAADGRFASPNDSFGVNTFATSQGVEALLASWLPIARRADAECPALTPTTTTTPPVAVAGEQAENVVAVEDGTTAGGELPRTGSSGPLAAIGVGAVGVGVACVAGTRRRGA